MCELQSSLKTCREELNVSQQQMEELKKNFETKLQKKNEKVAYELFQSHASTAGPCLFSSAQRLTSRDLPLFRRPSCRRSSAAPPRCARAPTSRACGCSARCSSSRRC